MARKKRLEDGIEYFPLSVKMLRDKKIKLIKGEFGANGILIFIYLLSLIYEENGYFKKWTYDDCILISEEVGCGCTPGTVAETVKGCVRRSLFDNEMFTKFNIITSAGIQRRYIRAASQREEIQIIKEYWLLNDENRKDIPEGIFSKISFKSISTSFNGIKTNVNPQSKVKVKVKENNTTPLPPSGKQPTKNHGDKPIEDKEKEKNKLNDVWLKHKNKFSLTVKQKLFEWIEYKKEKGKTYKPYGFNSLLVILEKKIETYGESMIIDVIDESMANNYQGIIWDKLEKGDGKFGNTGSFTRVKKSDISAENKECSYGTIL